MTRELAERQMLISCNDYQLMLCNCRKDRRVLAPVESVADFEVDVVLSTVNKIECEDKNDSGDGLITGVVDQSNQINEPEMKVVQPDIVDLSLVETVDCEPVISSSGESSKFSILQKEDSSLSEEFKLAERVGSNFFVDQGSKILFKKSSVRGEQRSLLVLPIGKRRQVLNLAHDEMGHYGVKKTCQILGRNFYWPRMREDVTDYVKTCIGCQHKRRVTVFDRVPIQPFCNRPTNSFEVVSLDLYGPITPTSTSGHKYVLGVICLQSRWVECYPLKSLKPSEVVENLMKFFSYAGYPKVIISDNATNFVSKLNKLWYDKLGIEFRTSTPFHSEGNATIERYWGTFRSMLTHVINGSKPREWHKALPYLLACYRGMRNETTGASPYMLVHGHEPRTVLDVLFDIWSGQDRDPCKLNKDDAKFLSNLKKNIKVAQDAAIKVQTRKEDAYVERYNNRAKDKCFNVGDKVLILMPDSSSKVKAKWIGPGEIRDQVSPYSYLVKMEDGAVRLLHANKLRLFNSRVNIVSVLDDEDEEFGEIFEYPRLSDRSDFETELNNLDLTHLSVEHRKLLKDLLRKYRVIFSNIPGTCPSSVMTHKIELREGFVPKKMKPYQLPERLKLEVEKQLDDLLKLG